MQSPFLAKRRRTAIISNLAAVFSAVSATHAGVCSLASSATGIGLAAGIQARTFEPLLTLGIGNFRIRITARAGGHGPHAHEIIGALHAVCGAITVSLAANAGGAAIVVLTVAGLAGLAVVATDTPIRCIELAGVNHGAGRILVAVGFLDAGGQTFSHSGTSVLWAGVKLLIAVRIATQAAATVVAALFPLAVGDAIASLAHLSFDLAAVAGNRTIRGIG
jgi:hypothetical protein